MKRFLDFIEENCFAIFISIFFCALIIFVVICEYQMSKTDLFDLEKSCYTFYKENNYILEECDKYKDKLRKEEE